MKTVKKTARVETAYGTTLDKPLTFDYEYQELEANDTIPDKEQPDDKAIRSLVNGNRNAKARSSAQNAALQAAGIEKPTLEDPKVQFAQMVKALVASGKSEEQAKQIAGQFITVPSED